MTDFKYSSGIGLYIDGFLQQKRVSGYPYETSGHILAIFDRMIYSDFPDASTITKEICDGWITYNKSLSPNTLLRRVTPVRQLGKYMNGIGVNAYVIPGRIPSKQIRYEAHIFTEKEIMSFFSSVDGCPVSPFSPVRHLVIPVIFRLIFSCGMRSSEARKLLCEDVNLSEGCITIKESKAWKARLVYVGDEMLSILKNYDAEVQSIMPDRSVFFPNRIGNIYSQSALDTWFHEFWDILPEAQSYAGNAPRVHDFRHTYCVYRLNQWVREGADINALYPYMSEFLGHSNFADTDYYLSLVPSFYPELKRRMAPVNDDILPEVIDNEE